MYNSENPKMVAKRERFIADLVQHFGEKTIISLAQLLEFHNDNEAYPDVVMIRKNLDYRVQRGYYVVTGSKNPGEVRDEVIKNLASTPIKKTVKEQAIKLAKAISQNIPYNGFIDQNDHANDVDTSHDDIGLIMRTMM